MRVTIRVDSSVKIGSGHMIRCLTLAKGLRNVGIETVFLCRILPGNVADLAMQQGFLVFWLELDSDAGWSSDATATKTIIETRFSSADWLVVDNYQLDACWESVLRTCTTRIMVIDDLANRQHNCDLLLDIGYEQTVERYQKLVLPSTKLLLGPGYVLLREEFSRASSRNHRDQVKRIQVFFGGSDPTGETEKVLDVLANWEKRPFSVGVIVGASNPKMEVIQRKCLALEDVDFAVQVSNMAERMQLADLSIGAGGTTIWERCYMGLPSIVISVAENQVETACALAATGAIHYLGFHTTVDSTMIRQAIEQFLDKPQLLSAMSLRARKIVPYSGTEKVVDELLAVTLCGQAERGVTK